MREEKGIRDDNVVIFLCVSLLVLVFLGYFFIALVADTDSRQVLESRAVVFRFFLAPSRLIFFIFFSAVASVVLSIRVSMLSSRLKKLESEKGGEAAIASLVEKNRQQ